MRLFGKIDGAVDRVDRAGWLTEPFDLAVQRPLRLRGGARAVFRPGVEDGLVWPTLQIVGRPSRLAKPLLQGQVDERADAVILAFCRSAAGTPLLQADVRAMFAQVVDLRTGTAVPGHAWAAVSRSSTVFDTLQTRALDFRWNRPTGGANFIHALPGTAFPTPDRRYRYQCQVTEVGGAVWYIAAEILCRSILRV